MTNASRREDSQFDQAVRAGGQLEHMIHETSDETIMNRAQEAAVEEELKKQRLLEQASTRVQSRILFITSDSSVTDTESSLHAFLVSLTDVFDEIHIILLAEQGKKKSKPTRVADKVWIYETTSHWFFRLPHAALVIARQQLEFTDGFRPDIVVALDPFESGMAALQIAERFDRPWQVQVHNDFFQNEERFLAADPKNKRRLKWLHEVMVRAVSVRASTDALCEYFTQRFKHLTDVALLPRFYHTKQLLALPNTPTEDKFPQFKFTILFVGELGSDSTFFRVLDATRAILQTPSIGLVVIGEGSARERFRDRAKLLGIDKQVVFRNEVEDIIPYLQSADLLVVTDTTVESDELVIKAAATGTPLIMAETSLRADLFVNGQDAFLCPPEDTLAFYKRIVTFINTNGLRNQFASNGREVIRTRIEEDPRMYHIAYRDTIERVLYRTVQIEDEENTESDQEQVPAPTAPTKRFSVIDGVEMHIPESSQTD